MLKKDEERRLARPIVEEIGRLARDIGGPVRIMEVCGTHTVELRKAGIHSLIPDNIVLISGPGCPVCVTPGSYIDNALDLVRERRALIVTFGDMVKVPGSDGESLSMYTGTGRVKMVYSPGELPVLAEGTDDPVVFLGIGFETTIPVVASAFLDISERKIENLYLYTAFKTVVPALRSLLAEPECRIDGFLLPGHVSVVLGSRAYSLLEEPGGVPGVIAGFEPMDMLWAILLLLRQVHEGRNQVENAYPRAVKLEGNQKARTVMDRLLEPSDDLWRGLGEIPGGALSLREEFRSLDAVRRFSLPDLRNTDPPGCLCGAVIQGKALPPECGLFSGKCTPDHPIGPCMVSSEGTCAAYLRYGGA